MPRALLYLRARASGQAGQATAEYALVLLGAAAVALMAVNWATHSDVVGKLFDTIFGKLLQRVP